MGHLIGNSQQSIVHFKFVKHELSTCFHTLQAQLAQTVQLDPLGLLVLQVRQGLLDHWVHADQQAQPVQEAQRARQVSEFSNSIFPLLHKN